jgi:hypothetical protein
MVCLVIVLSLDDWRWFQTGSDQCSVVAAITHTHVYPVSILARNRLLRAIEAPPPACHVAVAPCPVASPDDSDFRLPRPPRHAAPLAADPLYALMSLQR